MKTDEVDIYINFLTEFAFYFYTANTNELSTDAFDSFIKSYLNKFHLPVEQQSLLTNLRNTKIIALDSFNNYTFCYPYLYYFFVAKYLAEHASDNEHLIDSIINNLHKDENAYIAIFISHHSNNTYILDELIVNASCLFDKYKPATLSKEELSFFDEQVDIIVKAVLPPTNVTPEQERAKRLETQDAVEESNRDEEKNIVREEEDIDDLEIELRRSIKTVEVMGRIIKNRAGSLEKARLEVIFEEAMKVHLRLLTSFFELIKQKEEQQGIVDFISKILKKIEDKERTEKAKPLNQEKLEKLSKTIFWNINFFIVYGFIDKMIHSLGSSKLTTIIEKVCDNENTPASFILKTGMLMWYNKNLMVDNIANKIDEDAFSKTAERVMEFMIVNHCAMHKIGFRDKQKIEQKLGIRSKQLLLQQAKGTGEE